MNIIQVYAPTSTSSKEEIETFYEELEKAISECTSQDPLIIMGDFNAKVGQHGNEKAVAKHGLGIRNERGEQVVIWCDEHDLIIGNTIMFRTTSQEEMDMETTRG
ncbi:craniofacial development protein 2-like [Elysia marginata]|uniref:Craniofacial development protein 2-like n=1 Tax=Elysia marginata TaxID=1093978 RepID=A0AAV4GAR8_9GAST|nr:craniofacial development protein 2-like [Elysia marginata]